MTVACAAPRLLKSGAKPVAVRATLFGGCAVPALAFGLALTGNPAFAGCTPIGTAYLCSGSPNETLNAGDADNFVVSSGSSGYLTINGQGGNDSIVFINENDLTAFSAGSVADGGDGDDLITVQDSGLLWGNILGGNGADNILVELGASLNGSVSGGSGNDTLTVRDNDTAGLWDANTTVTGDLSGGDGDDAIMMLNTTTVEGDIDAGNGADKITLKLGTTLGGDLLAGADNDSVLIRGQTVVLGYVSAGDGADLVKILEGSSIGGSVLGDDGNDSMLLDGGISFSGSTIEGDFDGGTGDDTLLSFGASTVLGDVLGGAGDDALLVSGSSTVDGNVDGDDGLIAAGNDLVTIQDSSLVKGSVLGGNGNDSLLVEGNATVQGAVSGGDGDDLVTVTSGEVLGGIGGGDGNDTVNLTGGKIGGGMLDLGAGNDTLNLVFDDTLGGDALDLTGVSGFDAGTGTDGLTLTGFDADYSAGGGLNGSFDAWETVTAVGSRLQFSTDPTVTALELTAGSGLFQTDGLRAILAADGSNAAGVSVDATSYIDMRDAANLPQSNLPQSAVLIPLPSSVADDALTVADLNLTGSLTPLTLPTLRVDFDADDTTYRNGRDDAVSGNADQIDASNSITTTGTIGILIDATGGYLDMGMPVGLAGSVAIIDDLQSTALTRPGLSATLVASTTYVPVTTMPVDPARQWALVDQGNGGVYLQWTTVIDDQTVGANSGAELAVAQGGGEVLSSVLTSLTDGNVATRSVCGDAAAATVQCSFTPVSVWAMASGSTFGLGSAETSAQSLIAGLDYVLGGNWNGGIFASVQQGSSDLGSIEGAFGTRASNADYTAGYVGAYLKTEQDGAYFSATGAVGKASTDLVNGALFGASSNQNSLVGLIGATAGKRIYLKQGWNLDPRVEALYTTSGGETHTDSEGLALAADASQARVSATVGLTYHADSSPLSLGLRAGTAFLISDTSVNAGEAGSGDSFTVDEHRSDKVFTASVEGRWTFSDRAALVGSVAADRSGDVKATRGTLTFTYEF